MAFYVRLRRVRDDRSTAAYSFAGDDGQTGEATIDKSSGRVTVTRQPGGAAGAAVTMRAEAKLRSVWRNGTMPETAEWAS